MYIHPYSGFKPNFRSELEVKLTVELYAQGSQRSTPQSDLYYTDLTNMFYIRKSVFLLVLKILVYANAICYSNL
ncbi:hypothetical protein YN1551_0584 [Sulfolobus islandicus Y.N.15.51]|uniref:Uncharacterized protein n=1 Tax=Saccharolobus islandicus (strain Y.N.15.51 / Yellowstone \|nr:hypothetical protein YN1551_0584 [Sulfolobus islandicus Y.N.15.51]